MSENSSGTPRVLSGVYVASRVKHAELWKKYRAAGTPIISSWIDEAGEGETADFGELWARIQREIDGCGALVFYAASQEDFPFKGALVEVGIALALGKPVYVVLNNVQIEGRTLRPVGSWLLGRKVKRFEDLDDALIAASLVPSEKGTITAQQLADVKDQCETGLQINHDCPAVFALAAIYADLFADQDAAPQMSASTPRSKSERTDGSAVAARDGQFDKWERLPVEDVIEEYDRIILSIDEKRLALDGKEADFVMRVEDYHLLRNAAGSLKVYMAAAHKAEEALSARGAKLPSLPEVIQEWCWHMDQSLEQDDRHAAMALRAAWPNVAKWLQQNVAPSSQSGTPYVNSPSSKEK